MGPEVVGEPRTEDAGQARYEGAETGEPADARLIETKSTVKYVEEGEQTGDATEVQACERNGDGVVRTSEEGGDAAARLESEF